MITRTTRACNFEALNDTLKAAIHAHGVNSNSVTSHRTYHNAVCNASYGKKGSPMPTERKNQIIAGVLNMLIPGAGYLYVENDRNRFVKTFIGGVLLITIAVFLSNAIQNIRGYPLPQGLCAGGLLLIILVPLFLAGQRIAHLHNNMINDTEHFNVRRARVQGDDDARLKKIQTMRDEGLISEQEYQKKKRDLSP